MLSVWDKDLFCSWNCPIDNIKQFFRSIKWSYQRATKGYCDFDWWNTYLWFEEIMAEMIKELREKGHGFPSTFIQDEEEIKGTAKNWHSYLKEMETFFRELNDKTCSKKNKYEDEYWAAYEEFENRYGTLGERLNKEEKSGERVVHFPDELPEYKEISKKYWKEEKKINKYKEYCKKQALQMFIDNFDCYWE